ncbi:hypothetical protein CB172_13120 [Salmonella enterica subsp. enterica serovar Claibornei]|nr:hypothetical protein [Salmonella enterica subsp. enterica serovar Claibornei]
MLIGYAAHRWLAYPHRNYHSYCSPHALTSITDWLARKLVCCVSNWRTTCRYTRWLLTIASALNRPHSQSASYSSSTRIHSLLR